MGIALKKPDDVAGSAAPAIIIGMFVAFGGVLFGYVPSLIIQVS
jgi:SP family sugar:H+ symporter-like MFS transporter